MDLLIKSAVLVNRQSPFHLQKKDIYIKDGIIHKIADKIELPKNQNPKVFEANGLHVSAGWFDMKVNFRDPGDEHKEDILSGTKAAAYGGFTGVLLMPSTNPVVENKQAITYIVNKANGNIVDVFPAGALTEGRSGKNLTEIYDMKQSGAVAFTDDKRTIEDAGLMIRALQYCKQVNTLLIAFAEDKHLSGKAQVNESLNTLLIGLKGQPPLAEELIVTRDLSLLAYTEGKMHISMLSTAGALTRVKEAKKNKLGVTTDVSAYHLFMDDGFLSSFDSNLKTKPPLRSREDIKSLIEGLIDGTIDVIVSDHSPQNIESKQVEFDFASFGMINCETAFAIANTVLSNHLALDLIIDKFTAARKILGLGEIEIRENEKANLTLFNPNEEWVFKQENIKSRSSNTPFINTRFKGKVYGIFNNNNFQVNTSDQ